MNALNTPASVIVTDAGFARDDWTHGFAPAGDAWNDTTHSAVDVPSDFPPDRLAELPRGVALIRVDFPTFSDGRGFTIARSLRRLGFAGRLRARGHVIADQYAMARRSGFDEVEIPADIAARQPEDHWRARSNWREHDYQARLRG